MLIHTPTKIRNDGRVLGGQDRQHQRWPVGDGIALFGEEHALDAFLGGEDLLNLGADPLVDGLVHDARPAVGYRLMRFSVVLNR